MRLLFTFELMFFKRILVFGSLLFAVSKQLVFAQSINSINPDSAYQGQNLQVVISGTDLDFNQTTSVLVWLKQGNDSITASHAIVTEPQTAYSTFNFPLSANTGFYDFYFRNTQNLIASLLNGFRILPSFPPLAGPVLINPDNNLTLNSTTVSFEWDSVSNATMYELIVDNDISFLSPFLHTQNVQTTNYYSQNLSFYNQTYFWKVRARNISGVWGNWSDVDTFTVYTIPQLTNVNPDNGYLGQNNLSVNITGINTHFTQGSGTIDFQLQQNTYTINPQDQHANSNVANILLNIPPSAPTGFYNLLYYTPLVDSVYRYNAFYVHESNEYSGTVFFDSNNNQVFDVGEAVFPNAVIHTAPLYHTITQSNGTFIGYVPMGNYTLSVQNVPSYFSIHPAQHSLSFSGTGGVDNDNHFALQAIPGIHDLNINLTNSPPFLQPGFTRKLTITVKNAGPVSENGQVVLNFPTVLTLDSASNSAYSLSGNTATWNYADLQPFEELKIDVYFMVALNAPLGTSVAFTATVSGLATDFTPQDNQYSLERIIANSYDPNIKEVFPADGITYEHVTNGDYLEYTVHFQNTGTAPAVNIRILDTLSSFLDINSFQMMSSSHPYVVHFYENRLIEFRFDNIDLPDSTANEPLSHGFIKYRIKPVADFSEGDDITNTAYIYFDFNSAIVTNTTHTQIVTGIEEDLLIEKGLVVFPNPFDSQTNILYYVPQNDNVEIKLFNQKGQLVDILLSGNKQAGTHNLVFNRAGLNAGVYFISMVINDQKTVKKVLLLN